MRRGLSASVLLLALPPSAGAAQQPPARGVRELTASLRDSDPGVRAQAACSLRELGDRAADAIPALITLMDDGSPLKGDICESGRNWGGNLDVTTPGQEAASALVAIGTRAFDPVAGALRRPVWFARRNAAWALGALRDPRG